MSNTKIDRAWIHHTSTKELRSYQARSDYKHLYDVITRRQITFVINQREGKHNYDSQAAQRARLLGQLQYYVKGMLGGIGNLHNLVRDLENTDIAAPTVRSIKLDIIYAKGALDALGSNIRHINEIMKKPSNKMPPLEF